MPEPRRRWIPAGLLALTIVPVLGGTARLLEITGAVELGRDAARYLASPAVAVVHIACALTLLVAGVLQLARGFRRARPRWHRVAGRVLVVCGLVAGGSGLWMVAFYPRIAEDGALIDAFRIAFGIALIACLALGALAIRRGDVVRHGAWMTRGYAIAMGAGTQAVFLIAWAIALGTPEPFARAILHGAAWGFNLAIAEWSLHQRRATARTGSPRTGAGTHSRTCSGSHSRLAAQPP